MTIEVAPEVIRSQPTRSRLTKLAIGSSLVLAGQAALLICGIFNNFVVARLLGPEGKGIVYLIQVISGILVVICNMGVGLAAVHYLGRTEYKGEEIASTTLVVSAVAGGFPVLLSLIGWAWIHPLLIGKIPVIYYWIAVVSVPLLVLTWNGFYFVLGKHEIHRYNTLRVGQGLGFTVLLFLVLAFARLRTTEVVSMLWLLSAAIPAVFAVLWMWRQGGRLRLPSSRLFRRAVRYGYQSQLGGITQYAQHRADILLVGCFMGVREVGIYSLAVTCAELLWNIPHAVGAVLMPHLAETSEEQAGSLTPLVCRVTILICATLSLGILCFAEIAIRLFVPAFRPAIRVLWLLLPGVVAATVFKVLISDFNARGRPLKTFYPALISLVFSLTVGLLIVPRYGISGAAIVTTCSYFLNSVCFVRSYTSVSQVSLRGLLLVNRKDIRNLYRAVVRWFIGGRNERLNICQEPVAMPANRRVR